LAATGQGSAVATGTTPGQGGIAAAGAPPGLVSNVIAFPLRGVATVTAASPSPDAAASAPSPTAVSLQGAAPNPGARAAPAGGGLAIQGFAAGDAIDSFLLVPTGACVLGGRVPNAGSAALPPTGLLPISAAAPNTSSTAAPGAGWVLVAQISAVGVQPALVLLSGGFPSLAAASLPGQGGVQAVGWPPFTQYPSSVNPRPGAVRIIGPRPIRLANTRRPMFSTL